MPRRTIPYGFRVAYSRSLGQRIAGTRMLRNYNGPVPGFRRAGWVMLLRVVLLPLPFALCLLGMSTFGIRDRHISIDALKFAAQHFPP
ncbi:hypothetical protein [Pseudarthrobacter sulfonivorans]|uniref:hypothetical protein n=1 Tax=Pseudarthrobacter sulfonivorans TaxID=121292 RepID=UPI0027844AB9|nr:hypothetical protein [Pseudarthrobacter sulfonivorans]MDP9998405.1 hypothetical protein [Pseudarthrobacter sulfonivorans]